MKLYPSSAAFMAGPLVDAKYSSSCLRYIWTTTQIGRFPGTNNAESAAVGTLNEFRHSMKLPEGTEREKPFTVEFGGITVSGRMDFVLPDGTVHEIKSTTSDYVKRDVIDGGVVDQGHMAQLVSYLAFGKIKNGAIFVTYYEWDVEKDAATPIADRKFDVQITDTAIFVDGELYKYGVKDLARWYAEAAKCMTDPDTLPPEPVKNVIPYKNPCHFCPLKSVCESGVSDAKEFITAAGTLLAEAKPEVRPFKIKKLTARRLANQERKKESK